LKFSELWRLSKVVYKEVTFQSIFSLRAGASMPRKANTDIKRLISNAELSTLMSKAITSIFIAIYGFMVFLPLIFKTASPNVSLDLPIVGSVSSFLAVVLFLIVFMGLQVATSFMGSKITEILSPLPLSRQETSTVLFLSFLRIFDAPLICAIIVIISAYSVVGGSFLGGLVAFLGIVVTEIFAIAITIGLARFFFSRVAGGSGRSKWQTLLRFVFMLVWIIPSLGTYLVINFAMQIVESFSAFAQIFSSFLYTLVLVYPFSYGFLVSFVTFGGVSDYLILGLSIAASFAYLAVAVYCMRWAAFSIRKVGTGVVSSARQLVRDVIIQPQDPLFGIIRKDFRIASRSPSYASLFLLPAIQTIVLSLSFSSFGELGLTATLGFLTGISMITLLLPPTLFSIEGLASTYTRSLPLKKKTLIFSKTLLSTLTYVISIMVLTFVALFLGKDFAVILIFGAVQVFSVAAANSLELIILANKFWKEGFAIGNIYARLSTYILIILPGLVVAIVPIMASFIAYLVWEQLMLPIFLGVALSEFVAITWVANRQ
jgi:hypothetical protein